MYYDYIKPMSFKDSIITEISDMVKTKEPLYKITYIKPKLSLFDDPSDDEYSDDDEGGIKSPIKYAVIAQICIVIFDKSTWLNTVYGNYIGDENTDSLWKEIISMKTNSHKAQQFGSEVKYGHHIVCKKISIELLN